MTFKEWLQSENFLFREIGEMPIQKITGSEIFKNPALETAMYMAYRLAYDPIAQKDNDDPSAQAWDHGEWTHPSSGGTRAPAWTFYGSFPTQNDLDTIKDALDQHNGNVEQTANYLLSSKTVPLNYMGGISYKVKNKSIKVTGSYGPSTMQARTAKMLAMAHLSHDAEDQGNEMLLGVDKELRDMLDAGQKLMPKFHQKGLVRKPALGIDSPPPEVMPLLYKIISTHPAAGGSGEWKGLNPETGAMQFQLSGTGLRDKYIYGNKHLWQNNIKKVLDNSTALESPLAKMALQSVSATGVVPGMLVNMVNKAIQGKMPDAPPLSANGVKWLVNQVV